MSRIFLVLCVCGFFWVGVGLVVDAAGVLGAAAGQWVSKYRPVGFGEWMFGRGEFLWSGQLEIGRLLESNKRVAVQSCHGIGKSFSAAAIVGWWVDRGPVDGVRVLTTAPSTDQVHGILWQEITKLHARLGLRGEVQQTDRWLVGSLIQAEGRKPPDYSTSTFQGVHAPRVLVVLDEACGIPSWLWDAAEAVTTGDDCRILAIGNPDDPNSHFARVCQPGYPGWVSFSISAFDSPNFTGEAVPRHVADSLTTRLWAEERRLEWGEDSPKYISKVLGRFPSDHPFQIVAVADLVQCHQLTPRGPWELLPVELGVDVGGGGDRTVIRERRGVRMGRRWSFVSERPEETWRHVLRAIRESGATSVKVDANGIGHGVVGEGRNSAARGEHAARVHGVLTQRKASDERQFLNLRAELWWVIGRVGSQNREWDLSQAEDYDTLEAELMWPRWKLDVKGRTQVEDKDEIRKRTGRSPDDAEAALLAFYVPPSGATDYMEALMAAAR
jgi:hypothetical protein